MELQMWLEQLYLWRLQREHADPKQERIEQSENELPVATYPEQGIDLWDSSCSRSKPSELKK